MIYHTLKHFSIAFAVALVMTLASKPMAMSLDTIVFSHATHSTKVEVECKTCHVQSTDAAHKGSMTLPAMSTCASTDCHSDQVKSKDTSDCSFCHKQVKAAKHFTITRELPRYSHEKHPNAMTNCTVCHAGIEKVTTSTQKAVPVMASCTQCHNNRSAPSECSVCHVNVNALKPASHSIRWLDASEHGVQARVNKASCDACHQQSSCDQCHRGQRSTRLHDVNYRFSHGIDAKTQTARCATCHDTQRFCSSCH